MAEVIGKTSDIMKNINECMNIKELNQVMQNMQKEMMKMGMMEEMIEGAMESLDEDDAIDNEQDVEKLIMETEMKL